MFLLACSYSKRLMPCPTVRRPFICDLGITENEIFTVCQIESEKSNFKILNRKAEDRLPENYCGSLQEISSAIEDEPARKSLKVL